MTYEEFRNLAQGIQAILLSTGMVVGACWAIYTFRSLLSVQKSKAELEKNRAELERLRMQLEAHPTLSIQVEPSVIGSQSDPPFGIRVKLIMKNVGNTFESVDWSKSSIKGAKVQSVTDGRLDLEPTIPAVFGRLSGDVHGETLWPDESATDEAFIPIEEHGLYLVEVSIAASSESTEIIASASPVISPTIIAFETPVFFDTRTATVPTDTPTNA